MTANTRPGAQPIEAGALFAAPQTWLGIPHGAPGPQNRAAIIGIPFDCGTHPNRIGARMGPASIREWSSQLRRHDPFTNIDIVSALGLIDCGDVKVTSSQIEEALEAIETAVGSVLAAGAVAVSMGGDGMVSLPQMRAMARHHKGMVVVHIDAHTDAYPIEGYNTATSFRYAAQEGLVDVRRSFHIGARGPTLVPEVFEYCAQLGYNLVTMRELRAVGYEEVTHRVIERVGKRPVYLCFDMDFFDPSAAPGVCTPTWGGCLAHEGLEFLEKLAGSLDVKVLDVNTVSPPHDAAGMTAFLAATVMWTFLSALAGKVRHGSSAISATPAG
jgi:guanidinobutyrase